MSTAQSNFELINSFRIAWFISRPQQQNYQMFAYEYQTKSFCQIVVYKRKHPLYLWKCKNTLMFDINCYILHFLLIIFEYRALFYLFQMQFSTTLEGTWYLKIFCFILFSNWLPYSTFRCHANDCINVSGHSFDTIFILYNLVIWL